MTDPTPGFSFDTPGSTLVEWAGAARMGELLGGWFAARNVLIVTDKFLNDAGVLDAAKASLAGHGFTVSVFDDVVADPPEAVLTACVAQGRAAGAQIVMGLGGGSSMDIAKLVAVMLVSEQPLAQLYGIGKVTGQRLPLVQVPTTAGTGSEVTNITILTTGETTKMGIVAHQLYADRVLLDAELTVGLPPMQTAATGIDAMVHAIEAYTSRHKKNLLSDIFAREALRLLARHLVPACQNGQDRAAREGMLIGANFAGQAFSNSPVGAVHALAYPLGGHFHLPHGLTNALMLGPVLRHNMSVAAPLYAQLADVVLGPSDEGVQARSAAFVGFMEDLMDRSGAPRRLRDVGVGADSLPMLARDAMLQTRLLQNNPVEVDEAAALSLYRQAF
ncbi:iron-containing alcohol dehydrogenase [Paracoccus shanxieyensis]|uniref:Alcohol dehydrogenase 2 n=1 Tax=Paracoccus shanxieyensis TaxID=2675752 RepID=A0A6L6IUS6_9RHOB|nr:iron-containing alcohol dehydrogenase [Paracoccus shanxieyensis]MTH63943.1 iron-containing alcohol dehydrogenase [Paracoccus shanxieyensis]MTH87016.1 iron-containing alcohol dehydrogenase [Paracoccus shanxieyensis]